MSSVDDGTIMDVLRESDEPRLTTTAVAERLPLARGTVRSRLQALADEGRLDRERDGRHVVWFLPGRADEASEAGEADEASGTDDGTEAETEADDAAGDEGAGVGAGAEADEEDADETGTGAEEPVDESADGEDTTVEGDGEDDATAGEGDGEDEGEGEDAGGPAAGDRRTGREERSPASPGPATDPPVELGDDGLRRAALAAGALAVVYLLFRRLRRGAS